MILDNTTFVDQMTQRLKSFPQTCGASALFYVGHATDHHANLWGLRVECPAIGKEFCDNIAFGRDPEGFLFYHALDDFDTTNKAVHYHAYYNNESPRAVRVDFHSLKSDNTENKNPFCTFITRATEGLTDDYVKSAETNGGSGAWKDVFVASSYGKVRKETTGDEVTIVMDPIGKEIIFDTAGYSIAQSLNTMGTFTYPDASVIKAGTCKVDFNPDRVVLYDSAQQNKMIGFFIPVRAMAALKDWNWNSATIKDIPASTGGSL